MKPPIPIYLAVEDDLSEWIVRRILSDRSVDYAVGAVYGRTGFGYLKKQASAFNNAAKGCVFLLLADLDRCPCPPQLIEEWLGQPRHPHFLLRVAVREVESWLLGDAAGLCDFFGLRKRIACQNPEQLADPKGELLKLAMASPRRMMREALVWKDESGGKLLQGPDYNATLAKFVVKDWNIRQARRVCSSLDRLFVALDRLEAE
ncbi:MAG: hypothetical protein WCI20_10900 [bacterium]